MRYLTPIPKQFVDQSGIPYSDGTVSVYLSGSDELADIFEAAEGDALCPNPCRLDSNGAWQCFVPGDVPLDYIVQDKDGNVVFPYYDILPGSGSGSGAVFTVKGTEGEIKVTNRVTASGRREATVGLDSAFKQRVDQVEDDIGDLNEEMRGAEGSIQELNESVDHLDDRVEEAEAQVGEMRESLAGKKDRQEPVVVGNIPANRTVERIFQNANGEIEVDTQDIEFPDYSQQFNNIEGERVADSKVIAAALNDLNTRVKSVEASQDEKNIGERIADALDSQKLSEGGIRVKVRQAAKSIDGAANKTVTNISQDENGIITVTFSAISLSDYEKIANKKTSVTGNESSNTYYPTIKALVDYLNSRLQNLGGKKITNNGVPFTASSQLPSTTPYYGQNVNSGDYAYVQDTGLASRYTATVTGSSVAWSLDYEITIPVFTTEQQAAIDSGVNSTKVDSYDAHLANTSNPHGVTCSQIGASPDTHTHQVVINGETKTIDSTGGTPVDLGTYLTDHQNLDNYLTKTGDGSDVTASFTAADSRDNISTGEKLSEIFGKIAKWFADLKAVAFSGSYADLNGTPTLGSLASKNSIIDSDIGGPISDAHIASASIWNNKQNAIADLSDIRDGASKGETAVQPEDLATYMTNPVEGGVIAAALNDLNARLDALEYEDDNIGDKIADKFDAQVLRCGGVDVKTRQAAKESPSASGTSLAFIDSVSQNENGEISATKKEIPSASVLQPGIVQLDSTVDSMSTTQAATPSAVKAAYDLANGKKDRQSVKNFLGSSTKTITGLSQDANGVITPEFDDIDFDSKVLSFYPQSLGFMTPDERAALNAKMQEVAYNNGGMIVMWDGRNADLPCVLSYYDSSEYHFYRVEKYVNGIEYFESIVTYDSITKTFNVDQSSTTIDPTLYEKIANKKTTITGNETSTTYYPNMKAVVDYINGVMQNLGGKLITDNGSPFSDSTDLPSSTPYNGIAIQDKDYAYVQSTGTAERWSATVTGSSVSWVNEYTINIPVFTPSQQAIIDGDSSDMTATFSTASTRANISTGEKLSVLFGKIAKWFADLKAVAFTGNYRDLSGTPTIPEAATSTPKPVSSSNGSTGSSLYFAKGDHVHKIVVDEGVNNGQVSIAGQSVSVKGWATKQDALPTSGTPADIYAINVSGYADHALKSKIACGTTYSSAASITKSVYVTNNIDYSEQDFLIAVTFVNGNSHENYIELSFDNVSYTVTDGRVKWIRAGMTYLFALNTMATSDGKFVGDLITMASFEANARGTTYTLTDNQGIPHTVDAYPYQSPTNIVNTFRYNTQSFTNGIGSSLTKILMLNESGGVTLNWAQYPEPRFDFIDMTIRVCGFYNSTNAISEVITVEPYKYVGSYISAGLPELSSYILLLNDGVNHPFTFTVHLRMSYKEFLSRIGGTGTTLNLGFTFSASTSSSNKHSITFVNIWTSVTYHGDHS